MLTAIKLTGSPEELSEYHFKEENYYFSQSSGVEEVLSNDGGSTNGAVKIHGNLCSTLGLKEGEEINQETFNYLLSGKNSKGEKITREHKVIGVDLTFSAPKSVSISGLLLEKDPKIIEAHDLSVLETMKEIEATHAHTRLTKTDKRYTGNMAFVTVRDGFNREHEPHLHTHVVVMNMTEIDGKVLALDGREILFQDFNKFWGSMYRTKMASRLKDLGYSLTYLKNGEWRMNSVSLELEKKLSTRRQQILAEKARGALDMAAWRKTRKDKDPGIFKGRVKESWQEIKESCPQLTTDDNFRMALDQREAWFKEAVYSLEAQQERNGDRGPEDIKRWLVAVRRASDHSGCPTKEAIFTEYLTEYARSEDWKTLSIKDVEHQFENALKLGVLVKAGENHFTSWDLVRAEREWWEDTQKRSNLKIDSLMVNEIIKEHEAAYPQRQRLSAVQKLGLNNLFNQDYAIIPIQGDAGSGKTTMMRYLKTIAEDQGLNVVGLAMQGVAAQNLEAESGIRSKTMISFLNKKSSELTSNTLIVVDEASMMDSRSFSTLLKKIDLSTSKVILVGDVNQLESIGAGRPFGRVVDKFLYERVIHLNENFRQKEEELREAVTLARKGMMRESLDILNSEGRIKEIGNKNTRLKEIAKLYDENTLIVVGTTSDRHIVNQQIRSNIFNDEVKKTTSELDIKFNIPRNDGTEEERIYPIRVGEKLVFLKNEYKELDVRNGERGVVTKISQDRLTLLVEDTRTLEIDLSRYNHFDYGYALTTYKAQGLTYDKVVIESDTTQVAVNDMRHQYVNITRARNDVLIFTDDKEAMRDYAGIMQYKRDTLDDKKITLSTALEMESRVKRLAIEAANEKIQRAEEFAKPQLEIAHRSGEFKIDFTETKWVEITNEKIIERIGNLKDFEKTIRQRISDAESLLNNSREFSFDEKLKVAQFLSSSSAEKIIFSDTLTSLGRLYVAADLLKINDKEYVRELPKFEQNLGKQLKKTISKEIGNVREL